MIDDSLDMSLAMKEEMYEHMRKSRTDRVQRGHSWPGTCITYSPDLETTSVNNGPHGYLELPNSSRTST